MMEIDGYILPTKIEWDIVNEDYLQQGTCGCGDEYVLFYNTESKNIESGHIVFPLNSNDKIFVSDNSYTNKLLCNGDIICWLSQLKPKFSLKALIAKKEEELSNLKKAQEKGDIEL